MRTKITYYRRGIEPSLYGDEGSFVIEFPSAGTVRIPNRGTVTVSTSPKDWALLKRLMENPELKITNMFPSNWGTIMSNDEGMSVEPTGSPEGYMFSEVDLANLPHHVPQGSTAMSWEGNLYMIALDREWHMIGDTYIPATDTPPKYGQGEGTNKAKAIGVYMDIYNQKSELTSFIELLKKRGILLPETTIDNVEFNKSFPLTVNYGTYFTMTATVGDDIRTIHLKGTDI